MHLFRFFLHFGSLFFCKGFTFFRKFGFRIFFFNSFLKVFSKFFPSVLFAFERDLRLMPPRLDTVQKRAELRVGDFA